MRIATNLDDLSLSEQEDEGLSVGVGVEDLSVSELSDVTHTDLLSGLGDGTGSELGVLDGESGSEGLLLDAKTKERKRRSARELRRERGSMHVSSFLWPRRSSARLSFARATKREGGEDAREGAKGKIERTLAAALDFSSLGASSFLTGAATGLAALGEGAAAAATGAAAASPFSPLSFLLSFFFWDLESSPEAAASSRPAAAAVRLAGAGVGISEMEL